MPRVDIESKKSLQRTLLPATPEMLHFQDIVSWSEYSVDPDHKEILIVLLNIIC